MEEGGVLEVLEVREELEELEEVWGEVKLGRQGHQATTGLVRAGREATGSVCVPKFGGSPTNLRV